MLCSIIIFKVYYMPFKITSNVNKLPLKYINTNKTALLDYINVLLAEDRSTI